MERDFEKSVSLGSRSGGPTRGRPRARAPALQTAAFDVVVVGGGPAGSVVAMCLARSGRRVALVEATAFSQDRFGETLPPEINPVLRGLGLWDAFQALAPAPAPGIVSIWGDPLPSEMDFLQNVHGSGWHVDRNRFDAMLSQEAVRAGAQLFLNRRACPAREDGGWRAGEIEARFLVDASGRNGIRLDGRYDGETDDALLAITLQIGYDESAPEDLRTYIETTPAGWWYTAPVTRDRMIAMFFTDPQVYEETGIVLGEQLQHAPLTARRLERAQILKSYVLHAPSSCRQTIFGPGWLAAGDSASCYDPLSGRGIFKALRQGKAAAEAVAGALEGREDGLVQYARRVRREYEQYSQQRRAYYAMERRWANEIFWRARQGYNPAKV